MLEDAVEHYTGTMQSLFIELSLNSVSQTSPPSPPPPQWRSYTVYWFISKLVYKSLHLYLRSEIMQRTT